MVRSGADEIRRSMFLAIRDGFDYTTVNGLTSNPTFTQNPTRQTPEPYVYVYSVAENEVDVTKGCVPIEYQVNVEVCIRYSQYRGGYRQANQILDEIINSVRGFGMDTYPSVSGFQIYNLTFGDVEYLRFTEEGANYYKVVVPFYVSATEIEEPGQVLPVQSPTFTYNNFMFTPSSLLLERYDAGNIIPDTTYSSANNGWNFVDASFAISAGAAGTLSGGMYNITPGIQPVRLDSTLRYTLETDATETTSLVATTEWQLIDSLRYGAIDAQVGGLPVLVDDTSATYGLRNLTNWNIEFGTVTPHNETVTISGDSGQYVYIIVDSGVTLTQIRNTIGQNAIGQFNVQTVGSYKAYINENPIVFDNFETDFTLVA